MTTLDKLRQSTLIAAALCSSLALSACEKIGPLILQSDVQTQQAYSELSREWVRWALALPWTSGPILDPSGEACELDQSGKVWFLAGTSGGPVERDCTVPRNKALFFPLVNRWIVMNNESVDTPEELEVLFSWAPDYFASSRAKTCSLTLRVDGEDILPDTQSLDAELYVEVLEPFDIELNDDNWATQWGKGGGHYDVTLVDGHWALLEPLAPGDHVVEFGGAICDDEGEVQWETSAVYNLYVEGHPHVD